MKIIGVFAFQIPENFSTEPESLPPCGVASPKILYSDSNLALTV